MVFRRPPNTFIGNFYLKLYLKNINMLLWFICCVQLFASPRTVAHQASLSLTISWSLPKFMSIELVMLSRLLILCHPLLLEKEEWNWRNQPAWLKALLQSHSHQESHQDILCQYGAGTKTGIYRSVEQNRKPRGKSTYLWTPYLRQSRQGYTMKKRQSL